LHNSFWNEYIAIRGEIIKVNKIENN